MKEQGVETGVWFVCSEVGQDRVLEAARQRDLVALHGWGCRQLTGRILMPLVWWPTLSWGGVGL